MALTCDKSSNDYLRTLLQLLPAGYAWQWSPISAGRHLLAAWADELVRVHHHYCELANEGISRFAGDLPGWSKLDYENLMLEKFNISAEVSDGLLPLTCESKCTDYLLEESIRYVIVFTVADVSEVPQAVFDYLDVYKQSHTHYIFRDRSVSLEQVVAIDSMHLGDEEQLVAVQFLPTTADTAESNDLLIDQAHSEERTLVTNGLNCESPLYEQVFKALKLNHHWSFDIEEVMTFPGWSNIAAELENTPLLLDR